MAETKSTQGKQVGVYIVLLIMAALQFVIAYSGLGAMQMLFLMLALAIVEAGIAAMFFMHLGSERHGMLAFVGIITVFVLLAMQYGWTDSFRILNGAPWSQTSSK
ncbi:MAG TPA: cytochrome C oxidase subunit IV family protein [Terriglobales bacterium]